MSRPTKPTQCVGRGGTLVVRLLGGLVVFCSLSLAATASAAGGGVQLADLIEEGVRNNPEMKAAVAVAVAAGHREPQAESLADPMVMVGYQNDGFDRFNYGESKDAQLMVSASQMFPYPGKRMLKRETAAKETEALQANAQSVRHRITEKIAGLYYDLFLASKTIDLLAERTALFTRVEEAAAVRYSSGMGSQQEVLMAQTEKYMIREREEMQRQRIRSTEAMLGAALGRDESASIGRPPEPVAHPFSRGVSELLEIAGRNSHVIRAKEKMVAAAETKVETAKKESYPDFTVAANYAARGGVEKDMWSLTTQINVPLYRESKQQEAVFEAEAALAAARYDLEATRLAVASGIRDAYAMLQAAEKLLELYRIGLIPKASQDVEAALVGYRAGKVEAITVLSRMKALIDFKTQYWEQFAVREKAVVRLMALAEMPES